MITISISLFLWMLLGCSVLCAVAGWAGCIAFVGWQLDRHRGRARQQAAVIRAQANTIRRYRETDAWYQPGPPLGRLAAAFSRDTVDDSEEYLAILRAPVVRGIRRDYWHEREAEFKGWAADQAAIRNDYRIACGLAPA